MSGPSSSSPVQGLVGLLAVDTEVSAKFRGAYCEARVSEVKPAFRFKVTLPSGETSTVEGHELAPTDQVLGPGDVARTLSGHQVTVQKVIDASVYTVVFDDSDQRIVRRNEIKLKGQRHFRKGATLESLPLVNPALFSSPVCGKGSPSEAALLEALPGSVTSEDEESCDTNDEDELNSSLHVGRWIDQHQYTVVWVERSKGGSFPGLVINPEDADKKRDADNHCIIRSFRDSRFYSIPFKYIQEFEAPGDEYWARKPQLKTAVETANIYLETDELPDNWQKTPRQIYRAVCAVHQRDSDLKVPERIKVCSTPVEVGRLFLLVWKLGGIEVVSQEKLWHHICGSLAIESVTTSGLAKLKSEYKKYLSAFEVFFSSPKEAFPETIGEKKTSSLPKPVTTETKESEVISTANAHLPWNVDDHVMCEYRAAVYPAKVLKVNAIEGLFFVHYRNWNSRHDEWVSEERIIGPCDPTEAKKSKKPDGGGGGPEQSPSESGSGGADGPSRRLADAAQGEAGGSNSSTDDEFPAKHEVPAPIILPDLKKEEEKLDEDVKLIFGELHSETDSNSGRDSESSLAKTVPSETGNDVKKTVSIDIPSIRVDAESSSKSSPRGRSTRGGRKRRHTSSHSRDADVEHSEKSQDVETTGSAKVEVSDRCDTPDGQKVPKEEPKYISTSVHGGESRMTSLDSPQPSAQNRPTDPDTDNRTSAASAEKEQIPSVESAQGRRIADHPRSARSSRDKRSSKRFGRSGTYRHGFFISDDESDGERCQPLKPAPPPPDAVAGCDSGDTEQVMDVKALDAIEDIDERIRLAELNMNILRKRYRQRARELEKLDNLKKRIRKKRKNTEKQRNPQSEDTPAKTDRQNSSNSSDRTIIDGLVSLCNNDEVA